MRMSTQPKKSTYAGGSVSKVKKGKQCGSVKSKHKGGQEGSVRQLRGSGGRGVHA